MNQPSEVNQFELIATYKRLAAVKSRPFASIAFMNSLADRLVLTDVDETKVGVFYKLESKTSVAVTDCGSVLVHANQTRENPFKDSLQEMPNVVVQMKPPDFEIDRIYPGDRNSSMFLTWSKGIVHFCETRKTLVFRDDVLVYETDSDAHLRIMAYFGGSFSSYGKSAKIQDGILFFVNKDKRLVAMPMKQFDVIDGTVNEAKSHILGEDLLDLDVRDGVVYAVAENKTVTLFKYGHPRHIGRIKVWKKAEVDTAADLHFTAATACKTDSLVLGGYINPALAKFQPMFALVSKRNPKKLLDMIRFNCPAEEDSPPELTAEGSLQNSNQPIHSMSLCSHFKTELVVAVAVYYYIFVVGHTRSKLCVVSQCCSRFSTTYINHVEVWKADVYVTGMSFLRHFKLSLK